MVPSAVTHYPSIAIFPAGEETLATSRLRNYTLHRSLKNLGVQCWLNEGDSQADLLYVQTWDWRALDIVRRAQERGASIIFDFDNPIINKHPVLFKMLDLADIVTTSSARLRSFILKNYPVQNVHVLRDPVDYNPSMPAVPKAADTSPLRLFWFGSIGTTTGLEKYLPALQTMKNVVMVTAAAPKDIAKIKDQHPMIECHPWTLETFIPLLRSCHMSVLMHDADEVAAEFKSNQRMITSIIWGLPAIVSRTRAFEDTAKDLGVEYALFSNAKELRVAVNRLRAYSARQDYLKRSQPGVWSVYSPETVAKEFLVLARETMSSPSKTRSARRKTPSGILTRVRDLTSVVVWKLRRMGILQQTDR